MRHYDPHDLRLNLLVIAVAGILTLPVAAQESGKTAAFVSIGTVARPQYSRVASTALAPQVQTIEVEFPKGIRRYGRAVGPIRVVKLNILVQQDGKAGDVQIAQSSGFSPYDKAALSAAQRAIYLPAMDNGTPVESRMDYEVSFGLLCNRAAGNTSCDHGKYPTTCSATVCGLLMR